MAIDVNPNEEFHTVIEGQVMALSLDQLDNLYQRDVIQDDSLIWQPGLGEWMRLDTVLYELAQQEGPPAAAAPVDDDLFHVMIADDDVKQMRLDKLDDAYRLSIIDLDTLVWQQGYSEWIPLGVLLGEGEEEHVSIAPSMPAASPSANPFLAPSVPGEPFSLAPSAIPPSAQELEPAPSIAPAPSMVPSMPAASSATTMQPLSVPNSLGAVEFELPEPAPRKSKWIARSYTAMAAAAALFVMHQNGVTQAVAGTAAAQQLGVDTSTPHGIETWLSSIEQKYGLDQLSETEPVRPPEVQPALKTTPLPEGETTGAEGAGEKNVEADSKADGSSKKKSTKSTAKSFGAALSGKPAPRTAAPRKSSPPARKKSSSGSANLPSTTSAYDPMNGTL